jgi:hypothetical protein
MPVILGSVRDSEYLVKPVVPFPLGFEDFSMLPLVESRCAIPSSLRYLHDVRCAISVVTKERRRGLLARHGAIPRGSLPEEVHDGRYKRFY